ncbi:MAG: ABC transporter permease [Butyrivibrio sp.]|nr:ABC transporter permease [Butyrivibrio sp.]
MGTFGEYFKSAIASIKNNKGRSLLTMLGIIIGIAAVLTVLVIGDGLKSMASGELENLDVLTIDVSLDASKTDKCFTPENMAEIENSMGSIYGFAPSSDAFGTVKGKKDSFSISISGTCDAARLVGGNKIVHGRYFSKDDVYECNYVCVISQIGAQNLFGYENAVGETLELTVGDKTKECTVVGIREDTPMDTAYATRAGDKPIITADIPYTAVVDLSDKDINNLFTAASVYVHKDNKDIVNAKIKSVVENVLGLRGESAVKVKSTEGMDAVSETILSVVTTVVGLIASISLLVGGIGVMNIMTVSVTERTREIGIRKSLGARTSSILTQFLAEAAILTSIGGVIGIILGLLFAKIACMAVDFEFVVNPLLVAGVVGISTGIGLFFGIYPARRAAKLNPIDALRSE